MRFLKLRLNSRQSPPNTTYLCAKHTAENRHSGYIALGSPIYWQSLTLIFSLHYKLSAYIFNYFLEIIRRGLVLANLCLVGITFWLIHCIIKLKKFDLWRLDFWPSRFRFLVWERLYHNRNRDLCQAI
jgi:hypothetical protein